MKNKLKSEILNDKKKHYKLKCLSAITKNLDWQILTKTLVSFKRWMRLKTKNVNTMRVHQFSGEVKKNNICRELPKKGRLGKI